MHDRLGKRAQLKKKLRTATRKFLRADATWQAPIRDVLQALAATGAEGVLFGGVPRSLLLAKLFGKPVGRPRDLDIVISKGNPDELSRHLKGVRTRYTRFGGLKLHYCSWQFDIWPVESTWMFREARMEPKVSNLPETTFFNLEAVAVDFTATTTSEIAIYSGNDQFFDGILDRQLELNKEANPFPELCVVRTLVMAAKFEFKIGPRLQAYLGEHGRTLSAQNLEQIQLSHYHTLHLQGWRMKEILARITDAPRKRTWHIHPPLQLTLFGAKT